MIANATPIARADGLKFAIVRIGGQEYRITAEDAKALMGDLHQVLEEVEIQRYPVTASLVTWPDNAPQKTVTIREPRPPGIVRSTRLPGLETDQDRRIALEGAWEDFYQHNLENDVMGLPGMPELRAAIEKVVEG